MAPLAVARIRATWITGDDEVEATSWADLATKIKAPAAKKGATAAAQKMKVLNHLGEQGWELVSYHQRGSISGSDVWTFKRRVKK
jgi:hypothetical protein